jgi:hypothetical protein
MRTATYDLGFAWEWPYDAGLVRLVQEACLDHGVTCYTITPDNVRPALAALAGGTLLFRAYYDRASDSNPAFVPFTVQARALVPVRLNDFAHARRAWDKATMHLEFLQHGIEVPYTVILPPYDVAADLAVQDLAPFGAQLYLKPAHGGGGEGVALVASWNEIQQERRRFPQDKYLMSAAIEPALIEAGAPPATPVGGADGRQARRRAWFRVIYACGTVFPSWWDQQTHVYTPVSDADEERFGLAPLRALTRQIAQIAHLEVFSTEIARTAGGRFVPVDYVNDPCDLRLQSQAPEAVPDVIVQGVAGALARWVAQQCESPRP